jgi:hypothetical protein
MDGITMIPTALRRSWPGLAALAWLVGMSSTRAHADGPIPIATDAVFYYRFDVKIGPAAFARPAGPWYSYFPIDPNLLAQPRVSAFPNWPNQFPTPGAPVPPPGMTYYPQQGSPYSYGPAQIYPAGYQAPVPAYWYGR